MNTQRGFSLPVVLLILGLCSLAALAVLQHSMLVSVHSESASRSIRRSLTQERAFNDAVDRLRFHSTGTPAVCSAGVCGLGALHHRYWTPELTWNQGVEHVSGSGIRHLAELLNDSTVERRWKIFVLWREGTSVVGFQGLVLINSANQTTILSRARYE